MRAAGTEVPLNPQPSRPGEQQRSAVRIDKAAELLGWKPEVDLATGLRETFNYFAERHAGAPAASA